MGNKKTHNLYIILCFIAISLTMSTASYAQDTSGASSFPSTQTNTSTQNQSFENDASELSRDLVQQLGISQEKSDKISRILTEYRSDIADIREKATKGGQDPSSSSDVTGGRSRLNMDGILGEDVEQYYAGATSGLMSDYKDADREADEEIRDVLDDQMVEDQYDQVKDQWWSDVKEKVFSSVTQSSSQPVK